MKKPNDTARPHALFYTRGDLYRFSGRRFDFFNAVNDTVKIEPGQLVSVLQPSMKHPRTGTTCVLMLFLKTLGTFYISMLDVRLYFQEAKKEEDDEDKDA